MSIKSLVTKFILKFLDFDIFLREVETYKIKQNFNKVSASSASIFSKEADVENLAQNRNRIIIGEGTFIRGKLIVWPYSDGITIGKNCYIGINSQIWSGEKIVIGDNVLISHNVTIIDSDSHEIDHIERSESYKTLLKKGHPKTKGNIKTSPIYIEDYVWISYNVSILKGVKIGQGAIIAAGAVVTTDVSEFTMVAGNPARMIKSLKYD